MMEKKNIIQFIKFCLVGAVNTAVDWFIFYALTSWVIYFSAHEVLAKAIAFMVAVINSFVWNSIWTFRQEFRAKLGQEEKKVVSGGIMFSQFLIVSLIGLGINTAIFYLVRQWTDQAMVARYSKLVSLIFASGGAIIWNFLANKLWTYKK